MRKTDITTTPGYFDRYIRLVEDVEVMEAFQISITALNGLPVDRWTELGDRVYEHGKWTIKDIVQHIIDTERIFAYRALCMARGDFDKKPEFDENRFAANGNACRRALVDLIDELKVVRQSTTAMYHSFDEEVLKDPRCSFADGYSVLAIAYIIIGHQVHHLNILEERYYPLLK